MGQKSETLAPPDRRLPNSEIFFLMTTENNASAGEVDLFGNPMQPIRDRRGRPCFRKDKENQEFVAVRAAAGWSQDMIAEALGCDPKTLRKNFSRELQAGHLIIEGMMLDVLMRRVREGHTPSVRQLQERLDRVAPPAPKGRGAETKTDSPDSAAKSQPVGKKELRLDAAKKPSDDYGTLYNRIPRQ